jgi:hypothetical protein
MQSDQFPKKLVQVAKEFDLNTKTIAAFLNVSGFEIVDKPTSKISEEMYALLVKEFLGTEYIFNTVIASPDNSKKLEEVSKELGLNIKNIIAFLIKHGFDIIDKPTSKISEEMYALLVNKYLDFEINYKLDLTVKSISYEISYRKAFDIDEVDDIFCSIIYEKVKEGHLEKTEFAAILGFNVLDLAEMDVLEQYLKGLSSYNLIINHKETLELTDLGINALNTKLKYKYYTAETELFENITLINENIDFSFKDAYDLNNKLNNVKEEKYDRNKVASTEENKSIIIRKIYFQTFENNKYHGEEINIIKSETGITYKTIPTKCIVENAEGKAKLSIIINDTQKSDIDALIDLPQNHIIKEKLVRLAEYNNILHHRSSISAEDIRAYIDFWEWKSLAENPKLKWEDTAVFEIFKEYGDGSIWGIISTKAPTEVLKTVLKEYESYLNWTILTDRMDDDFIRQNISEFQWDFEELSYKEPDFVISLLNLPNIAEQAWDWVYLSKTLSDSFVQENISSFNWDYYAITEHKSDVLRNLLRESRSKSKDNKSAYSEILLSYKWNWKFISEKFTTDFLYSQIIDLAEKIHWDIVLDRFFEDKDISSKCIKDQIFEKLLIKHKPENYSVSHQNYSWSLELIDFLESHNFIQWETHSYIKGIDSNPNLNWTREIFQKYHSKILTESGCYHVSRQITEYELVLDYPHFNWDWKGISENQNLISNKTFLEKAYHGNIQNTNNLHWGTILKQSNFPITFWNAHLETFNKNSDPQIQSEFWQQLTRLENIQYVYEHYHLPWDWDYVIDNVSSDDIIKRHLLDKWNWEIATKKLDKITILNNIDYLAPYLDWNFVINERFSINQELRLDRFFLRIAESISNLGTEKSKDIWTLITAKYPFHILFDYIERTSRNPIFNWDWDYISNNELLPTDFGTLRKYKAKINWEILTNSSSIQKKFNYKSWANNKEWFGNTKEYLETFKDYWDWQKLSKHSSLNYNRDLLKIFKTQNWDWKYLSEFGGFIIQQKKDSNDYLNKLITKFPKIKFDLLSRRKDIDLDIEFILENRNKNWDWQFISGNDSIRLSNDVILELEDKDWNWAQLSMRKDISFDNELILKLQHKNWDWDYLSDITKLVFNNEFVKSTISKPWDWKKVSRNISFVPSLENLDATKDFDLDWEHISQNENLIPTVELLGKFENKLNWLNITKNPNIKFDNQLIERFASKWDWNFMCEAGKLQLSTQVLAKFKDFLNWDLISSNTNINFTEELIREFKEYWSWAKLAENKRVNEELGNFVEWEINNSPMLRFIEKIESQSSKWKGNIYHFTHIDNAIEIIKARKIQSRNKADIKGDAAGNVVHRRDDAHDYARFYFRPHTPTQFYNEYLGKNITDGYRSNNDWVSWYEKARALGFPKCPIPIFFRFSLKEVLFKNEKNCCISNGNMQTSSTRFGGIQVMIDRFGFEDLYYTPGEYANSADYSRYRNYAQQEFLVKNELSFEELSDFEIVCPSDSDKKLLIDLLGQEYNDIFPKIIVDRTYYNNENPRVTVKESKEELHLSTHFSGDGYFALSGFKSSNNIEILSGDVTKIETDKIVFKSNIYIKNTDNPLELHFIDESNRRWFLYKNNKGREKLNFLQKWKDLLVSDQIDVKGLIHYLESLSEEVNKAFNSKVRHYVLKDHCFLVCKNFTKFNWNLPHKIDNNLFIVFLCLHDIGKPKAFFDGNKDNQYTYSKIIINELWAKLPFSKVELKIVQSLLNGDCIGDYFQNKLSLPEAKKLILELAESCDMSAISFFKTYMIYYQCDIASYTADAGGIKFLEHLFEYKNGEKVFEEDEGLLKMSSRYWDLYKQLKNEIEYGN